jgi:hypothetical protein
MDLGTGGCIAAGLGILVGGYILYLVLYRIMAAIKPPPYPEHGLPNPRSRRYRRRQLVSGLMFMGLGGLGWFVLDLVLPPESAFYGTLIWLGLTLGISLAIARYTSDYIPPDTDRPARQRGE